MIYVNRATARKQVGVTYLGGVNTSSKILKNASKGVSTFIIYLAPHKLSGYNVCPNASVDCIEACLNGSGQSILDTTGRIKNARIVKTKLFYEDREFFMHWLVDELRAERAKAIKKGMEFSVRINGTSDISPLLFKLNGKNLLQLFPDVMFYDYTKVYNRVLVAKKHSNYDLTFSFSGYNWDECLKALANGTRVSVVFEKVPKMFKGIEVVNGDNTDLRYMDRNDVIVGLKFKRIRKRIDFSKQSFVIPANNPDCSY